MGKGAYIPLSTEVGCCLSISCDLIDHLHQVFIVFVEKCSKKEKMQHEKEEKGNKKCDPCLVSRLRALLQ